METLPTQPTGDRPNFAGTSRIGRKMKSTEKWTYYFARYKDGSLTEWEACDAKTLRAAKWAATTQVMGTAGYPVHRIIIGQASEDGSIKPIASCSTHPGCRWISDAS